MRDPKLFVWHDTSSAEEIALLTHEQLAHGTERPPALEKLAVILWSPSGLTAGRIHWRDEPWQVREKTSAMQKWVWMLHGVPVEQFTISGVRFAVPIFQHQSGGLYQLRGDTSPALRRDDLEDHAWGQGLCRLASRAMYGTGYDFGMVYLQRYNERHVQVVHVEPGPPHEPEMREVMLKLLIKFCHQWEGRSSFIHIGADCEFLLQYDKSLLPITEWWTRNGEIGWDIVRSIPDQLSQPVMEIRPAPTTNPIVLTNHIRQLLIQIERQLAQRIPVHQQNNLHWRAGAMPLANIPLGGHVHLSGVPASYRATRLLDQVLAVIFRLLESKNLSKRRPRYGMLGDIRLQSHGGFEYRTLPSWLISETLTLFVLSVAQTIVRHAPHLPLCWPIIGKWQAAYYVGNRNYLLLPTVEYIQQYVKPLLTHKASVEAVDQILDQVLEMSTWDEQTDFRKRWNMTDNVL